MNAEIAAVIGTIAYVASRTIYRHRLTCGADPITLLLFAQVGGAILVSLYAAQPILESVYTSRTVWLLVIAGFLWASSIILEIYALKSLYLVQSGILNSFAYVLMLTISAFVFGESFSLVGAAFVLAGVTVGNFRTSDRPPLIAFLLQCGHTVFNLGALAIDKQLTVALPPEVVGAFGFISPAVILLLTNFKKLPVIRSEIRSSKGYLLSIPLLNAVCYVSLLHAFQAGGFAIPMSIFETSNLISLIFGIIFLRELMNLKRNTVAAALTSIGAIILALWK